MNLAFFVFNGWYLILFVLYFGMLLPWMYNTLTTPLSIFIWCFVNALPTYWGLYALRHLRKVPRDIASKYPAFTRNDLWLQTWGYIIALFTNVFLLPRLGFGWVVVVNDLTLLYILKIGTKSGEPLSKFREGCVREIMHLSSRLHVLCCGVAWINSSERHFDYSQWLGPQWCARYEGAGI